MIKKMKSINCRINYIDGIKRLAIFLVIYHHVFYLCTNENAFSLHDFLFAYTLPLFFFVSGFVLYKSTLIWNIKYAQQLLLKKLRTLLIPTIIFLLFADFIFKNNVLNSFLSFTKNGYWFTITLFEYFVLLVVIEYLIFKFKIVKRESLILVLFAMAVVSVSFASYIIPMLDFNENWLYNLLGIRQFYYFIYFVFGILVRKHFSAFEKYIFQDKVFGTLLIMYIACFVFKNLYETIVPITILIKLFEAFSGILIVFSIFRKYSNIFENNTFIGKSLQFIGRRTLDIYLLHYFFLPGLGAIHFFSNGFPDPVLEFLIVSFFSIVTLLFCLAVSSVIRVSPSLAHVLFGVKKQS